MELPTYDPDVFRAPDIEAARRIIVTPQSGQSTDERWERETPYLAEMIGEKLSLKEGQLIIDYGCGIGRISKALIERFGCLVLGVDISQDMRRLAPAYVDSARFSVVSRSVLSLLASHGLRAHAAISIWVLQHSADPMFDITLLRSALRPGGELMVVNNNGRAVPTDKGWISDGLDISAVLGERFALTSRGSLEREVVGDQVANKCFWATYQ